MKKNYPDFEKLNALKMIWSFSADFFNLSISDCQCQFLQVTLAKGLPSQILHNNKQTTYQLSEEINGKSSWKSATQDIWYYPEWKKWLIGSITGNFMINSVGDTVVYDCPQQVPKDKWKYYIKDGDGDAKISLSLWRHKLLVRMRNAHAVIHAWRSIGLYEDFW